MKKQPQRSLKERIDAVMVALEEIGVKKATFYMPVAGEDVEFVVGEAQAGTIPYNPPPTEQKSEIPEGHDATIV